MRRSRIDRVKIITNGEISRPDHLIYPLELISVDKLSEMCQEEKATPESRPSRANVPNSKVSQERRQHLNSNLAIPMGQTKQELPGVNLFLLANSERCFRKKRLRQSLDLIVPMFKTLKYPERR
ncbi:hypothetical protein AVEN_140409-1 [Araneus ventricosus]|uniref:Uncharacterized protein n=1 Tax=Araneus ventricosus TaxID=182803 RepID=A0A4Y2T6H1_ARAVE|nr:hypothetical protein AVEN_140409-1 [Araneus ventricosus]